MRSLLGQLRKNLVELITHFILPIATLCLVIAAQLIRMTRAAVLNVMNSPYIEMAILKGIPRRRVVMRHALLNAIGPIVNVIAINLAYVVTGAIVIEVYFGYAGLATLIVQGVQTRDYILIQTLGMIFCATYVILMMIDLASILSKLIETSKMSNNKNNEDKHYVAPFSKEVSFENSRCSTKWEI